MGQRDTTSDRSRFRTSLLLGLCCLLIYNARYALWWAGRRRAVGLIAGAALPMLLVLFYNVALVI